MGSKATERLQSLEELQRELEAKNKELESAYNELKTTQAKIFQQEKLASIGQLAAGIAHEINNPIGFVYSNLDTLSKYIQRLLEFMSLQQDVLNASADSDSKTLLDEKRTVLKIDFIIEDIDGLIKESLEGLERVKKIVMDLKSFSRVDDEEYTHADVNECLETTLNIVWNELKYKATVTKEYGDIPVTKCYPRQLNQVFMNILVNAAQAIEEKGEIRIKSWHEEGYIFVSISDTGPGIPEENLNRIFEPFFTTKEVGKGTGLGLSITYDIVKKHGGNIKVESKIGQGTTFVVSIPVVEAK